MSITWDDAQPASGVTWDDKPSAAPSGVTWDDAKLPARRQAQKGSAYDVPRLKSLWVQAGGDPKDAEIMARVAMAESSGDPGASNAYSENGKQYGVHGLWQISDIHGPGNYADPLTNARKAVELHRASGLSPWEDSRNKGGGGGWGQYLPHETGGALAHALTTPIAGTAEAASPPITWDKSKATTAKTAPAKKREPDYTPLEQFGGILDLPFVAAGAWARNDSDGHFDWHGDLGKALGEWFKNPAKANAEYGAFAKPQLEADAKGGDPIASYMLKHPTQAGLASGIAEFFNPANDLAGRAEMGAARLGIKTLAKTPHGAALLGLVNDLARDITSPIKGITRTGGDEAKRLFQGMLVRLGNKGAEGQKAALEVFGNLSPAEQEDVVHLYQGELSAVQTQDPAKIAAITKRADRLRQLTDDLTSEQQTRDLLKSTREKQDYFNMKGAYEHPSQSKQLADFFDQLKGSGAGGKTPVKSTEEMASKYRTLAEAQRAGAPLRADFNPATQFERWFTKRSRNVEFDKSLESLPSSIIKHDPNPNMAARPSDGRGKLMVRVDEIPALEHVYSPYLRGSWVSQDLAQYLVKNSTRIFDDAKLYPTGTDPVSKTLRLGMQAWDNLNNATRQAIISNPLVHPVWNLSVNSAAAGLPLDQTAKLVTASVLNTMGMGKVKLPGGKLLLDVFQNQSAPAYQQALYDALKAGAVEEMKVGGKDGTRLLSTAWKDLSSFDKFKRAMIESPVIGSGWNNRLTFGPRGEEAFAVALHQRLVKMGLSAEEAAGQVREALGNYKNVDPAAWQSRVMFFYPWLKGNTAFWVRNLVKAPQFINAPARAARVNNEIVNAPTEQGKGRNPPQRAKDFQFIHQNADQSYSRYTPLLPQRILTDVEPVATGNPTQIIDSALRVFEGRSQPLVGAATDAVLTAIKPAGDPRQPQNYQLIYDKNAPAGKQHEQIVDYLVGKLAPIPLVKYQVEDVLRGRKVDAKEMLTSAAGLGFDYEETKPGDDRRAYKIRQAFKKQVSAALRAKTPEERSARVQRAYEKYDQRIQGMAKPKPKATPAGITWDSPAGITWDKP